MGWVASFWLSYNCVLYIPGAGVGLLADVMLPLRSHCSKHGSERPDRADRGRASRSVGMCETGGFVIYYRLRVSREWGRKA